MRLPLDMATKDRVSPQPGHSQPVMRLKRQRTSPDSDVRLYTKLISQTATSAHHPTWRQDIRCRKERMWCLYPRGRPCGVPVSGTLKRQEVTPILSDVDHTCIKQQILALDSHETTLYRPHLVQVDALHLVWIGYDRVGNLGHLR